MKLRPTLRRVHIWLGWIVGLPFLLWVVSGLVMVVRPIELVRGEGLLRDPPHIRSDAVLVPPALGTEPVQSVELEQRSRGPVWLIRHADGKERLADAATGRMLPPIDAARAAELVRARYTGQARIASVASISAERPPLEFRRKTAAWQVSMSDGTRFYVSKATGEIVARRTAWWRVYDLMWGLHIMDPTTREDTSNPFVIGFAIISLATVLLALALLPLTVRRRRR